MTVEFPRDAGDTTPAETASAEAAPAEEHQTPG
jgi:hypothetical protein